MPECPTPKKAAHTSKAVARAHMYGLIRNQKAGRSPGALHVYQCVCKAWHVGHSKPKKGRRKGKRHRR